jgi:hypothetical protein
MYTRSDLRRLYNISVTELDTLERQGIVRPTVTRKSGETLPVLYSPVDAAVAGAAAAAGKVGIRGRRLARFAEQLAARRNRLRPGWSGWAVFDGEGVDLEPDGVDLASVTGRFPSRLSLLLVPVDVPDPSEADR